MLTTVEFCKVFDLLAQGLKEHFLLKRGARKEFSETVNP